MTNASLKAGLALALGLAACTTSRTVHYWSDGRDLVATSIEQALQANPLAPDQNIRVTPLGATATVSHHLVQIRRAESPHIHRDHELTVFIYRGAGKMKVGDQSCLVKQGDTVFVPRGTIHFFSNEGASPAVAIVVFTPSFDGRDTVSAEDVPRSVSP